MQIPPDVEEPTPDPIRYLRRSLKDQGLQADTISMVMQSWRDFTKQQYGSYIKRWMLFCNRMEASPLCASVNCLIEFLTLLYNQGLGYSAINTAKSPVQTCTGQPENKTLWLVSKSLKGAFASRPALPRNNTTWDASVVLNFLAS